MLSAALGCSVATACGGQSLQRGGDEGAGTDAGGSDTGGAAPSGSGGATASGGSSAATSGTAGTAGTISLGGGGGTVGTGGTAGVTAGTAGAGGEPGICFLEPDTGPCRAAMTRFAFDWETGLCRPFTYGGCEGNENNFETVESCYAACGGQGTFDPTACNTPLDCTLVPSQCCGECLQPTLGNTVAINASHAGFVYMAMGCHLVDCVPCKPTVKNPWLGATCLAGRCIAFDARQSELTACSESADCRVRAGLGCCENCSPAPDEYVAVNRSVGAEAFLCGDTPVGCDACVPPIPAGLSAYCSEQGRCQLIREDL